MTPDNRKVVLEPDQDRSTSFRQSMRTDADTVYLMYLAVGVSRADADAQDDGTAVVSYQDYIRLPKGKPCDTKKKIGYCALTMMKDTFSVKGSDHHLMTKIVILPPEGMETATRIRMTDATESFTFTCTKENPQPADKMSEEEKKAASIFTMDEIARIAGGETSFIRGTAVENK